MTDPKTTKTGATRQGQPAEKLAAEPIAIEAQGAPPPAPAEPEAVPVKQAGTAKGPEPVSGASPLAEGKLTAFVWRGPVEGMELTHDGKTVWAGTLMPHGTVKLPADHPSVRQLVACQLLAAPPETAAKEA